MSTHNRTDQAANARPQNSGAPTRPYEQSPLLEPTRRVGEGVRNLIARLRIRIWVAAYEIEEGRQAHAAHRRYLRSTGCCVALRVLASFRGRT
jgi:hypothetical protein